MIEHEIQFFTATILKWQKLMKSDDFKEIVMNSLQFMVEKKRLLLFGFVIMPNHIHIIWRIASDHKREDVQRDLLKFTAQQFRFKLINDGSAFLNQFEVNLNDRKYQFWKRKALSIDLLGRNMVEQKLEYIHLNPLQEHWQLVEDPINYRYSSASFYERGDFHYSFLSDYRDYI